MTLWQPIWGGAYEITELGAIRRVAGGHGAMPGRLLRHQNKDGYRSVSLSIGGKPRRQYVHRLVAEVFIGPCPPGYVVNHRDGDKWNCAASNLEYVTEQENMAHAGRIGLLRQGAAHGFTKLMTDDVRRIRQLVMSGVKQSVVAREYKMSAPAIHSIVHGKTWKSIKERPDGEV